MELSSHVSSKDTYYMLYMCACNVLIDAVTCITNYFFLLCFALCTVMS